MSDQGEALQSIGTMTADLMEAVEHEYPDSLIGDALIAIEVCHPGGRSTIFHRCTADRGVVAAGIAVFLHQSLTDGARDK